MSECVVVHRQSVEAGKFFHWRIVRYSYGEIAEGRIWVGYWRIFWSIVRWCGIFRSIVGCCGVLWGVVRCCVVFCGAVGCYEVLWSVMERFEVLCGVVWCCGVFWNMVGCSRVS